MCPAQSRPQHHPGLLRLCPPTPFSSFSLANGYNAYSYWASSGQDNHPVASLLASLAHWRDLDNDSCTSTSTSLMPRPGEIELKENTYLNHTRTNIHTPICTVQWTPRVRVGFSEFKSRFFCLWALWSWASLFTSLSLIFYICKMEMIILKPFHVESQGDSMRQWLWKPLAQWMCHAQ